MSVFLFWQISTILVIMHTKICQKSEFGWKSCHYAFVGWPIVNRSYIILNLQKLKTYISVESRGYNLDQIYKKVSDKTFFLSLFSGCHFFFFTKWLRYLISVHKAKYHADLKNNNIRLKVELAIQNSTFILSLVVKIYNMWWKYM